MARRTGASSWQSDDMSEQAPSSSPDGDTDGAGLSSSVECIV